MSIESIIMNLLPKGHGAFIKILSLTVGITIGLVLIAKVQLEYNYDACIHDRNHVYEIYESFQRKGESPVAYPATPGGYVPRMRQYIPEIVAATRYTIIYTDEILRLEDHRKLDFERAICADSCFFDIFRSDVLSGRAATILATPGQCMVSKRLYRKLGEDALGKTFVFRSAPQKPMLIAGVYDDFDENTSLNGIDIIMSLPSIGNFTYDGSDNLLGNDRYRSYVRFRSDADMTKVGAETDKMLKECLPWDELIESGYEDSSIKLEPVAGAHFKSSGVKTTCTVLLVVAIVMLFTAVMNYILVVISTLVSRARQVALRKCLGAPTSELYLMTLGEAALHLFFSLLLMAVIIFSGRHVISQLLGTSVATLFSLQTIGVIIPVCLVVLLFCGLLPAYIYSRIPLVYAYRLYSESRRVWKLSLLAFQFLLSTMLLSVLFVISRQYNYLLHKDLGYDFTNVAYVGVNMSAEKAYFLARELEKLPSVESASCTVSLFCEGQSGDNVLLPDDPRELFNCCNLFFSESNLAETMGLELVSGKGFTPMNHAGWMPELLVDENFAAKMKALLGWDDVVGRHVRITGMDGPVKIVGVVKSFTIGSLINRDPRPIMVLNGTEDAQYILLRFGNLTAEGIEQVQNACNQLYPEDDLVVKTYAAEVAAEYVETLRTRNLISIGCIATLLILLVGLIGYVRDEVQRRSKELAIRKVMGAGIGELQTLFVRSIAYIALPSVLVGAILGYKVSFYLLEQFPDKAAWTAWMLVLPALVVLGLSLLVILIQIYKVALTNPVQNIKTE